MAREAQRLATVKRSVEREGENCVWQKVNDVAGSDAWLPSGNDVVNYNLKIVWYPKNNQFLGELNSSVMLKDYANVTEGILFGLVSGDIPFKPEKRDRIARSDGEVWIVEGFDTIRPSGTPLMYLIVVSQ